MLTSEYRELFAPILDFVRKIQKEDPTRHVAVVVPQIIPTHWYSAWIESPSATLLKTLLLFLGGPRVVVISTPWHVGEKDIPAHVSQLQTRLFASRRRQ